MNRTRIVLVLTAVASLAAAGAALAQDAPEDCPVDVTTELLDDGALVIVTSDDPDVLARMQERAEEGPPFGRGGRGHHGDCDGQGDGMRDAVDIDVTEIDGGYQLRITSDDPDAVARIQERAEEHADGPGCGFGRGPGHHGPGFMRDVDFASELLDNGASITLTSDDPDVIAELQEHAADGPPMGREDAAWRESATIDVETLDDGVRVTITSDDPDVVAMIQQHAERRGDGDGFRGHHGRGQDRAR